MTLNKQQYINEGGVKCPYCKSKDLKCDPIIIDDDVINQKVNCCTCNKMWIDVYTITDILIEN
ncbi:MAG: hypothetical protein U9Q27_03390 [Patescibacteria group bacterium]|nr:hypothetical protein [Patescibacteria group bacterium]